MTDLVNAFTANLDSDEYTGDDAEIVGLGQACFDWANANSDRALVLEVSEPAASAVYAFTTGLLLGALAMRDALNAQPVTP